MRVVGIELVAEMRITSETTKTELSLASGRETNKRVARATRNAGLGRGSKLAVAADTQQTTTVPLGIFFLRAGRS